MSYLPGDTIYASFLTQSDGAPVDADATPTTSLRRNGAIDSAITPAVTHNDVGDYTASAALPLTYSGGDEIELVIAATMSGVISKQIVRLGKLDRTAQSVAQVVYRTSKAHFVGLNGGPTFDGLSPATANSLPTQSSPGPGETIVLMSGTFALGTAWLNLSGDGSTGVNLIGAGMGASIITSTALLTHTGCIVKPGNGSQISDLTIQGIAATSGTTNQYQAPLGTGHGQTPFVGVVARRLNLIADSDGIYISCAHPVSLSAYDCDIQSNYDALNVLTASAAVRLYDCHLEAIGPSTCNSGTVARGVAGSNGVIIVHGGSLTAADASTQTFAAQTAASCVMRLYNVSLDASSTTGAVFDLESQGAELSLADCAYSPAAVDGTVLNRTTPTLLAGSQHFNNVGQTTPTPSTTALDGPYAITLIFQDAVGNPVGGVVFTVVGLGSAAADAGGTRTVSLPAGSYTVRSVPTVGLLWADAPITVSGDASFTLTGMATVVPAAPGASQTTGYLTTRDGQGNPTAGITLSFQLIDPDAGVDSFDQNSFTAISDSTGLLQVPLLKNTQYQARVGNGAWVAFTTGSGGTFALPEILGAY